MKYGTQHVPTNLEKERGRFSLKETDFSKFNVVPLNLAAAPFKDKNNASSLIFVPFFILYRVKEDIHFRYNNELH